MFAVQFDRFGPPEVLALGPSPDPHPGSGEIRVRVRASGVSPVDLALRAGTSPASRRLALPHVPGVDAAGVVDEVGPGVSSAVVGDEVFGAVDVSRLGGGAAELAVLRFWAAKPTSMSWAEAGAAATGIETATRALDLLDLHQGMTLLIDGAAGGVGSIAIPLAVARGIHVIGTGRPGNQEFIARLGATPTTYGPGLPERVGALRVPHVDRALDIAGAGSLTELIDLTGDPARVVTLADFAAPEVGVRISLGDLGGQANGRHGLVAAAALADRGHFRVPVHQSFPLARAAQGHAFAAEGPRQGKVVLTVPIDQR